ncbi:MAG: hypothetical protein HN802_01205 [Candidatus Jacksonbacteria bacterium]|jgi:hypothetical protein|nr:hypothetical protein [Candidatus Jacksonbacteria bacterium]
MSKQRVVNDSFWTDPYVEDLDPSEKLLFIYLLTNPLCNVAGIYEIKIKRIAYETGFDKEMVEKILGRFEKDDKLMKKDDWLIVVNFAKNQANNPNILKGMQRIIGELPDKIKALKGFERLPHFTLLNLTLPNLTKPNGSPSKKTSNISFTADDMKLVDLMVALIQRNNPDWQMKGNRDTWAEHIDKLHRIDGRTYEQIEFMIKWTQQDSFWSQNILSTAKLREKFNSLIPKLKKIKTGRQATEVIF